MSKSFWTGIVILFIGVKLYQLIANRLYEFAKERQLKKIDANEKRLQAMGFKSWEIPERCELYLEDSKFFNVMNVLRPKMLFARIFWDKGVTRYKKTYIAFGGALLGMCVLTWISMAVTEYSEPLATCVLWVARIFAFTPVIQLLRWKTLPKYFKASGIIYGIVIVLFMVMVLTDIVW